MPIPNHCIDCDKVAIVLNDKTPYCIKCYRKEYDANGRHRRNATEGKDNKGYRCN